MQNIDLLYTDKITFNDNNIETLYLNNTKIWGKPQTYDFYVPSSQSVDIAYTSSALRSYQLQCATQEIPLRTDKPVAVRFDVSGTEVVVNIGETANTNLVNIALDEIRLKTGTTNSFDILFRARKTISIGTKSVHITELYFSYPEV